jgi:sigma-B regulation protein RsbQ
MTGKVAQNLNDFFSGHLVVNKERTIVFCNTYICELNGLSEEEVINTSISALLTKASNIFLDSYIYPLLMNESVVQEVQITWIGKNEERVPVVVNIKLGSDGLSYWSLYMCATRDKLQSELLQANEKLEKQSEELFLLATTDPLTGLLNRRELYVQAEKTSYQATRSSSSFAVLSVDVDYFKRVNDTYGHKVGDKVLVHITGLFKQHRRNNDVIARIGGEEFVLLLADIDEKNAFRLAELLRQNIESHPVDNINVTISIGLVVTKVNEPKDFDELLQLSDNALYNAKASGRNQTSISNG